MKDTLILEGKTYISARRAARIINYAQDDKFIKLITQPESKAALLYILGEYSFSWFSLPFKIIGRAGCFLDSWFAGPYYNPFKERRIGMPKEATS